MTPRERAEKVCKGLPVYHDQRVALIEKTIIEAIEESKNA